MEGKKILNLFYAHVHYSILSHLSVLIYVNIVFQQDLIVS